MSKAKARKGAASRRRSSRAKTARKSARKPSRKPPRKGAGRKAAGRKTARKTAAPKAKTTAPKARTPSRRTVQVAPPRKARGKTREVVATPSRKTSPRGRKPSPYLERERKRLLEVEDQIPTPPSSLDLDRSASAVRTGRRELREALLEHTETSPALTGGDVDADWENAAASGEEAPGGDNPTPDQQRVDDIGKALGLEYQDNEELRGVDKIDDRDRKRWELDPASAEDYKERQK